MLNHQSASKYYEHDYLQNFPSLFMSLLTALIVKIVIFYLEFTISFEKTSWTKIGFEKLSIPDSDLREEIWKVVIK